MDASQTPPGAHASWAAVVTDVAVAADLPCRACGYNLRGLAADGRCPECHTSIADSLHSDQVHFAPERWLRRLHGALRLACGGVLLAALAAVAIEILVILSFVTPLTLPRPRGTWALLHFVAWAALTASVLITPPTRPNGQHFWTSRWVRFGALLLLTVCAWQWFLVGVLGLNPGGPQAWNPAGQFIVPSSKAWAQLGLHTAITLAGAVGVVMWSLHLRAIGALAGWSGLSTWLLAIVGVWLALFFTALASSVVAFALARAAVAANPAAPDFSGPLQVVRQVEEAFSALSVLVALAGAACLAVLARRIARIRHSLQPPNQ